MTYSSNIKSRFLGHRRFAHRSLRRSQKMLNTTKNARTWKYQNCRDNFFHVLEWKERNNRPWCKTGGGVNTRNTILITYILNQIREIYEVASWMVLEGGNLRIKDVSVSLSPLVIFWRSCLHDHVGSFKARTEFKQTISVPPSCKRTCRLRGHQIQSIM